MLHDNKHSRTCARYEDASIIYFINDLYKKRIHACTWKEKALLFAHARTQKRHQTQSDENIFWRSSTGNFFSEALILGSVNPPYEERLFIEFPEKYKFTTFCVQILFWMSKQKPILEQEWCKNEGFWKRFIFIYYLGT